MNPIPILIVIVAILLAGLAFWLCGALGLPYVVSVIAAILVILAGFGEAIGGGYRRRRW